MACSGDMRVVGWKVWLFAVEMVFVVVGNFCASTRLCNGQISRVFVPRHQTLA